MSLRIGIMDSTVAFAILFNNSQAAFDNAKKIIEAGWFGGNGSETHKSAVVGDTICDPFKDVAGPPLMIFMKAAVMAALLLLPWLKV